MRLSPFGLFNSLFTCYFLSFFFSATGMHSSHSLTPSHHAPPHLSPHPSHSGSGGAGSITPSAGIDSARISTDSRRPSDHFDGHPGGYGGTPGNDRHVPSQSHMPPSNSQQFQSPPSVNNYMGGSSSTPTPSPISSQTSHTPLSQQQQQQHSHSHSQQQQQQSPMNRSESPVISPQSMFLPPVLTHDVRTTIYRR